MTRKPFDSSSLRFNSFPWTPAAWGFGAALCVATPTLFGGNNFGSFVITALVLLGMTLGVYRGGDLAAPQMALSPVANRGLRFVPVPFS
jgi:hypothetical protein